MQSRHVLAERMANLAEIRDVMNSMKSLAFMETRKLDRLLAAQHALVDNLRTVAADLLAFEALPAASAGARPAYLVFGTERGFCGDLNQALVDHLRAGDVRRGGSAGHATDDAPLIAVGTRLAPLLEDDPRLAATVPGLGVAEEAAQVIGELAAALSTLESHHGPNRLLALHPGDGGIVTTPLLPPFPEAARQAPRFTSPPLLQLPADRFLVELTDQYLFAALHEVLFVAGLEENRRRMMHLDGAVRHLDDQTAALKRRYDASRQEAIIEEIEVILLNAPSEDA